MMTKILSGFDSQGPITVRLLHLSFAGVISSQKELSSLFTMSGIAVMIVQCDQEELNTQPWGAPVMNTNVEGV